MNRRRRRLDREELDAILTTAGVDPAGVRRWPELSGGTFNTAYRIDGPGLVLKVAPGPDAPVLTYERGIMATEAAYYRATAGLAPVPRVVHTDLSREFVDCDFLLMTECPGQSWHSRRDRITGADRVRLRTDLGAMVAALHTVTGAGFGYPQAALSASWRVAFLAMVDAVLADAHRFGAPLPGPATHIADLVRARADQLDEVGDPVLVHFDLWDGNILVEADPAPTVGEPGPRIGGLIDGERAFWGDPAAEFVSLALFGDIERDGAFLAGYRAAGGRVATGPHWRRRLSLYRTYLYLIMLVERFPRGRVEAEDERFAGFVAEHLRRELEALATG